MKNNQSILSNKFIALFLPLIISSAFIFGFLDQVFDYNFERLHIFLFNLTSGGFIILCYTENRKKISPKILTFLALSIIYALFAFMELYIYAIIISLLLFMIVESIRIKTFSFFPKDFFKKDVDVSKKFHQASILCLSLSLLIASIVILNDKIFKWIHLEKLTLDVFFLGYSFPVSLITMSVIFSFIEKKAEKSFQIIKQLFFWFINLGVILFFIFILFKLFIPEIIIASLLFLTVLIIFIFFFKYGINIQQKRFLISGVTFLLFTGITGVLYIILMKTSTHYEIYGKYILKIHAYLSLYGWNLSGLFVIIRWNNFPLRLNSIAVIIFHWIIILFLAPLSKQYIIFIPFSIIAFILLLAIFFKGKGELDV